MKKYFFILSFVITTCIFFSCSKDLSIKNNIEGTWGLTHFEFYEKVDGDIIVQEKEDCNPYAPIDSNDGKVAIINTNDNNYLLTFYSWDKKKSIWVAGEKMSVSIKRDKMFVEGEDRFFLFQLTSDNLIIEGISEIEIDGDLIEKEGTVKVVAHSKYIFRKMSDFGE